MLAGQILTDDTQRGIIRSYFYPIILVQDFTSRLDRDCLAYLCDCDLFHTQIVRERCIWLKDQKIKYHMHHVVVEQDNVVVPKIFRLYVELSTTDNADLYRTRWNHGQEGSIQPQDAGKLDQGSNP